MTGSPTGSSDKATLSYVNVFARDIVALSQFYMDVFGFTEIEKIRSPIFRGLDTGRSSLGFNAQAVETCSVAAFNRHHGARAAER